MEDKASNSDLRKIGKPIQVPQAKTRSHLEHTNSFNVPNESGSGGAKITRDDQW